MSYALVVVHSDIPFGELLSKLSMETARDLIKSGKVIDWCLSKDEPGIRQHCGRVIGCNLTKPIDFISG